ncbi:uncharacterized protein EV420DRAFT_996168 [Desarmillaria tabescens]|uniref:Uncharacterized protein n=1 Tax=Armillaria tabescens TaxID=1929756 RepID=A0AA39JLF7_ARMTA|nr:uncharacterized protein EV420DRAFT_996168 [Desarmillaria tabescens]KAK0444644.1 hypothetical protein EV420DRAFT_996168 [Desarmillaria tabescens]
MTAVLLSPTKRVPVPCGPTSQLMTWWALIAKIRISPPILSMSNHHLMFCVVSLVSTFSVNMSCHFAAILIKLTRIHQLWLDNQMYGTLGGRRSLHLIVHSTAFHIRWFLVVSLVHGIVECYLLYL